MRDFLQLVRWPNLLMLAATQYLMRWSIIKPILKVNGFSLQFGEVNFFLMVMAFVLIAAAGYAINDYFDIKTDMVNRPETVIVGQSISRRKTIAWHIGLNTAGIILGIYVSLAIGVWQLGLVYPLATGLLWYYSTNYKRQFLIGNLVVSLITAMVPLSAAVYEIPMLNKNYYDDMMARGGDFMPIFYWVLGFSVFAFLLTLIREIIKDIEDFEGDTAYGCNTLPIMVGTMASKLVVVVLNLVVVFCFFVLYKAFLNDKLSLYYILALSLMLVGLSVRLILSKDKKDFHFSSIAAKIIMIAGMFYSFVAYHNFSGL